MSKKWFHSLCLATAVVAGCSSSKEPLYTVATCATTGVALAAKPASTTAEALDESKHGTPAPHAIATTNIPAAPVTLAAANVPASGVNTPTDSGPALPAMPAMPEIDNLFGQPKVVIPVVTKEPEPEATSEPTPEEPKKDDPLPPLRLLGFVEVEGLKALLNVDGKLNVVTLGDSAEGIQIVAIEPPVVTLKKGEGAEFQLNLFEQPWFHHPGAVMGDRRTFGGKPVVSNKPSISIPSASSGPLGLAGTGMSSGTTGGNNAASGLPNGLPGFPGGNAGSQTSSEPAIPGLGNGSGAGIPGLGAGMPGLPGGNESSTSPKSSGKSKSSKSDKSSENSAGGVPGTPGMPGSGGMPGLPSGGGMPGLPGGAGLPGLPK